MEYESIYSFVIGGGAFYGILLAFTLFLSQGGNTLAKRLLATLILIYVICLLNYLIFLTGNVVPLAFWAGSTFPLFFLVGPFYLLYILSLNKAGFSFKWLYITWFLPYFGWQVYFFPSYFMGKFEKLNFLRKFSYMEFNSIAFWLGISNVTVNITFLSLAYLSIRSFRRQLVDQVSNATIARISWTHHLTLLLTLITLFNMGTILISSLSKSSFFLFEFLGALLFLLLILMVGVHTLNQHTIYIIPRLKASELPEQFTMDTLKEKIERYMIAHQPYLNSELKLHDLSERLHISPHQLSMIINKGFHQSFFEFVNRYRVEAAKTMLGDIERKDDKLIAIAYDAGFGTKTTFNRTFKRFTGQTPSQYKSKINTLSDSNSSRMAEG